MQLVTLIETCGISDSVSPSLSLSYLLQLRNTVKSNNYLKKSGLIPSINVHQILVGTPPNIDTFPILTPACALTACALTGRPRSPPPPSTNISVGLYIKGLVMFSKLTLLKQNKTNKKKLSV